MPLNSAGRPISILLVGGDDVHMRVPLQRSLEKRGFEVSLAGSNLVKIPDAISSDSYHLRSGISPISDFYSVLSLRSVLQKCKPTLAHAFDTKPGYLLPLAGTGLSSTVCLRTVTGMGRLFASEDRQARALRPLYERLYRWTSNRSHTVFQNTDDRKHFIERGLAPRSATSLILGSGIDPSKYDIDYDLPANLPVSVQKAEFRILLAGRLMAEKGVLDFINAAALLATEFSTTQFLVAGLCEPGFKAQLDLYDPLPPNVNLIGSRNDIPEILANIDVCVLPTYYREGVPRILLEAAASGVPLLTTDVPGCREIIKDGKNGIVIKSQDPESIAAALRSLLKNREMRLDMGKSGRTTIAKYFSLEVVTDQLEELYTRLSSTNFKGH